MPQWFGPKRVGYGIGPRSWQGWLACALLAGALLGLGVLFHPDALGLPRWTLPAAMGVAAIAFLVLTYATYEDDPD